MAFSSQVNVRSYKEVDRGDRDTHNRPNALHSHKVVGKYIHWRGVLWRFQNNVKHFTYYFRDRLCD